MHMRTIEQTISDRKIKENIKIYIWIDLFCIYVYAYMLNTYHLWLPASMSWLHPVFNIVKLLWAPEDSIPGQKACPPPPLEMVDGEEHYVVEQVLDSRLMRGQL